MIKSINLLINYSSFFILFYLIDNNNLNNYKIKLYKKI